MVLNGSPGGSPSRALTTPLELATNSAGVMLEFPAVAMSSTPVIRHLFVSPGHNYVGHHGREPSAHPIVEVEAVECVVGQGLVGDRYFGHKDNYKGQITFFAWEVYQELCDRFGIRDKPPSVFRRNAITAGLDLNRLIGVEFELQGIRFLGTEECRPCYWMDRAFAPGAEAALRGKGGLRARLLTSGTLRRNG